MKRWILFVLVALVFVLGFAFAGIATIRLDALEDPGRLETALATRVKHIVIQRSSRQGIPLPLINLQGSIQEGDKLFGTDCSECHGNSGRNPTDAGRWMYPRAADLGSTQVQQYSDSELFWIVKNGIRFSGMPAFGRVESDEHIWDLVHYVRTLPHATSAEPTQHK